MAQDIRLEANIIKRFVSEDRQERYLTLISTPTKRKKFIGELAHFQHLKFSEFEKLAGDIDTIVKHRIGVINDCYVISENKAIDSCRLDIDRALSETIGYGMGTFLVFGDAKIVYYEGEEPNNRWLSKPF